MESSYEEKGNSILSILEDDINYCLDVLRLDNHRDGEIETKVKKLLYAQDTAFFSSYHKRLLALKVIADFVTVTSNPLSRSQLYDFLMLSTAALSSEGMKEYKMLQETTNDVIFKIYGDLIENYQIANDILRLNYPQIIVDVVAVLSRGIDMSGKEISAYRVYNYYLSRKSQPISNFTSLHISNIMSDVGKNRADYDTSNDNLVQTLVRITGRNDKEIRESLTRLNNLDMERIRNLCVNYPKIDKYCRLVASDRKCFIDEIEREHKGNKLTKYQLHIAVVSIRKVRNYIENVLDRKFVPHSSHHINHTKHNLEYGYQVMGLIGSIKRRGKEESGSKRRI